MVLRRADKEEKGWIVDPKGEGVTVTGADKQKFGKVEDAPVDAEHFGMDLGKGDTQGKSHIIEKNGETYVIVGTGEAMKVKGVNDKTTMATSGLCSCAGVAIYGEGADGKPLLEVLHPMEDSNVAQQARAVSAVQQLEAEGATNLQIFVTVDPAATMGSKENALAAKLTYASDANPKLFGFAAGPAQLQHAMAEGGVKQKVEVTYAPRPPIPEAGLASPPMRSLYASTSGAGVVYDGGLPAAGHTWKRDAKP